MINFRFLFLPLILFSLIQTQGQDSLLDCKVDLREEILTFQNSCILVEYSWNQGDIRGRKITNIHTAHTWELPDPTDEHPWAPDSLSPLDADLKVYQITDHWMYPDHLVAEITTNYADFDLRRSFRLYPGLGVLAMTLYLKKSAESSGLRSIPSMKKSHSRENNGN